MSRRLTRRVREYMDENNVSYQVAWSALHPETPSEPVVREGFPKIAYSPMWTVRNTESETIDRYRDFRLSYGVGADGKDVVSEKLIYDANTLLVGGTGSPTDMMLKTAIDQFCAAGFQTHVIDPLGMFDMNYSVSNMPNVAVFSTGKDVVEHVAALGYKLDERLKVKAQWRKSELDRTREESIRGCPIPPMAVVISDSGMMMEALKEVSKSEYVQAINTLRRLFAVGREANVHMFVAANAMYESVVPHWMRDCVSTFVLSGPITYLTMNKLPHSVSVAVADEQRVNRGRGMLLRVSDEDGSTVREKFQTWHLPYSFPKEESEKFNQHRKVYREFLSSIPNLYEKDQVSP